MKFKDLFNFGKSKSYQDLGGGQFLGTHIAGNSLYAHYTDDLYENGYSSIRAISNRFMTIRPYAIDNNGKTLHNKNVVNVLARPSKDFSGLEFRDAVSVFFMVMPKTFILVWEKKGKVAVPAGENVREENIAGFTILEDVNEIVEGGKVKYQVYENGMPKIYYPHQVMTFFGINPNDLSKGYSPARAARRWSSIDDYIADYQNGFFRNGAIPAGQFIITAQTPKEFNDEVDNLEAKHKGAGNNNNIVYVHRPVDQNDGKPSNAKIEWIPFNTPNKDLSLKDLFEQANKKIDSVYGVSAFIRAIDEAPNFATAQVIERNFVENTVRPFALRIWTRFSHELNRITGGLGYALTFDLETPGIAEEEKLHAETDKIIVDTITLLVDDKGYTLESAIEAMKLPDNWKLLKKAENAEDANDTDIENDKPEVDNGDEVENAPEQTKKSAKKGAAKAKNPKALEVKQKNLTATQTSSYEKKVEKIASAQMKAQIERVIANTDSKALSDPTVEEIDKMADEMTALIVQLMNQAGGAQTKEGRTILENFGIDVSNIRNFAVNEVARQAYLNYVTGVAFSYSSDTADSIRTVLSQANSEGLTRAELEKQLRGIMQTDKWRVTRLGVTEVNTASSQASVVAMQDIQAQADVRINKIWTHFGADAPCEYCAAWIGTKVNVSDNYIEKGSLITGVDGGTIMNNWRTIGSGDIHPNGHCGERYEVEIV